MREMESESSVIEVAVVVRLGVVRVAATWLDHTYSTSEGSQVMWTESEEVAGEMPRRTKHQPPDVVATVAVVVGLRLEFADEQSLQVVVGTRVRIDRALTRHVRDSKRE